MLVIRDKKTRGLLDVLRCDNAVIKGVSVSSKKSVSIDFLDDSVDRFEVQHISDDIGLALAGVLKNKMVLGADYIRIGSYWEFGVGQVTKLIKINKTCFTMQHEGIGNGPINETFRLHFINNFNKYWELYKNG